ncbi:putative nucleotidyltransferase [compost metagenome]
MEFPSSVHGIAQQLAYPSLFLTISGAHLYGFPSLDSDFDLRGVHVLPLPQVVGLDLGPETFSAMQLIDGLEIDTVTHDAKKFFSLLLKRNGYVLEQLYSPLIVRTTAEHEELKAIARGCITRHHVHHYLGFSKNEWRLFEKEHPRRVKPLLYVFRVLLTGIHLMRTGIIEANLQVLNADAKLPYLDELIARKIGGTEGSVLSSEEFTLYEREFQRIQQELEEAFRLSDLPDEPSAQAALNDLLIRVRTAGMSHLI